MTRAAEYGVRKYQKAGPSRKPGRPCKVAVGGPFLGLGPAMREPVRNPPSPRRSLRMTSPSGTSSLAPAALLFALAAAPGGCGGAPAKRLAEARSRSPPATRGRQSDGDGAPDEVDRSAGPAPGAEDERGRSQPSSCSADRRSHAEARAAAPSRPRTRTRSTDGRRRATEAPPRDLDAHLHGTHDDGRLPGRAGPRRGREDRQGQRRLPRAEARPRDHRSASRATASSERSLQTDERSATCSIATSRRRT